ncbi:MAG: efflux transporter outer membrane subunit [Deltaproteobacteria bacterium]|nr:efflux transporter outer membrane subunit [Deltaproteobacteria bacterium]
MERLAQQLTLLSLLFFFINGCALGPNYRKPAVDAPENFRSAESPAGQASLADLPWWQVFEDPTLQQLISEALQNNYDLRVAVTRVEQARQIAAQARAQFFPAINYDGSIATGRNSFLTSPSPNGGQTTDSALLDLSVFWEIDLWGRIRRLNEAARAQLFATDEARRGVMISLVSAVAQAYFELLQLDLQLNIAKRNAKSFEDTLKIFTQRLEGGVASKLETSSAEGLLGTVAANVPEVERQIVVKENQINVLLGRNPGPVERSATLLDQSTPPEIPAGLPSGLLERRPDIRQAEQNLRAANAQVGVAVADFFPRIGLTTLLGRVSPELSAFSAGTANFWAVAGTMTGPIFQGGALIARHRQAKAAWEEAKLAYAQTALNAFQEVSNALITRQKLEDVRAQQSRAVKAYEEAVSVSLKRYVAGKASYYEVLQNQQQLFPAETVLAQTQLNQLLVIVQLYKALGGGWQASEISPLDQKPICP